MMDAKYRVCYGEGVKTFTDFNEAKKFAEQTEDTNTIIYLQVGTMCGVVWQKGNVNNARTD